MNSQTLNRKKLTPVEPKRALEKEPGKSGFSIGIKVLLGQGNPSIILIATGPFAIVSMGQATGATLTFQDARINLSFQ